MKLFSSFRSHIIHKLKNLSLQKKFFLLFSSIISILFLSFLFGLSYYSNHAKERVIALNEDTLQLQINALDDQLFNTSHFMEKFLLMDSYRPLKEAKTESDLLKAEQYVNEMLSDQVSLYSDVSSLALYAPNTDTFLIQTKGEESFTDRNALRQYLISHHESLENTKAARISQWTPVQVNQHTFLISIASFDDIYLASWYRIDHILSPLQSLSETSNHQYYLSGKSKTAFLYDSDSLLLDKNSFQSLSQYNIPIHVDSGRYDYRLWTFQPNITILADYQGYLLLFLFIIAMMILFLFLFIVFINLQIMHPIHTLTSGMEDLKSGNFGAQIPVPNSKDEFSEMMTTFNYMSREIKDLKIQIYEEKLEKVRTELDYLTLQIKPHFFLNCLNVIYSLALSKKTDAITQMTSYLIVYFRYLFRDSSSFVPVAEELEHARTYLNIQKLRSYSEFDIRFYIEPGLEEATIPVLSIQTFIENIFKHAYQKSEEILVDVSVKKERLLPQPKEHIADERTASSPLSYLHIAIRDNGNGFPEDQLDPLNDMTHLSHTKTGHVGISNVKRRLLNIYGDRMKIIFHNHDEGGAVVELYLPLDR